MLRRVQTSVEPFITRAGVAISDYLGMNLREGQDHHQCQYCRKIIIDPGTGIRLGQPAFMREMCSCTSCSEWFTRLASWSYYEAAGPVFIIVPGDLILEGLVNGCRSCQYFYNPEDRDMMIKRYTTQKAKVTDLVVSGFYRGENVHDLCRIQYKAPHFIGEQGLERNWEVDPTVIVLRGDISSQFVSNRAAIFDMSEPRTIEVARSWLERCSRDHSTCSPPESLSTAIAPSRIIRVDANANSRIQLIQTVDLAYTIRYVALSYCWGGDQLGKTLKSNVNRRKMPFSLFGQAKSIRDAVQVVRELGFSYLWVDSLCIIQDDQKDLATELSRMSDIYEQATLTISAAKSGTSTEGFLNPRSHITISNACGYRCPDGQIGIIQLQSPKKTVYLEPIHRRCWTLQEHLLSSRILTFGDAGLRWRCRSAGWLDGPWEESDFKMEYAEKSHVLANSTWTTLFGHNKEDSTSRTFPSDCRFLLVMDRAMLSEMIRSTARGNRKGMSEAAQVLWEWRDLIEDTYTQRRVTESSDRLPAISALAARFNNLIPGRYLAGHWEAVLPLDLLWEAWHHRPKEWTPEGRDQALMFPSWSWASIKTGEGISIEWWSTNGPSNITLHCEAAQISLRHKEFSYGHVLHGSLRVTGYLMEVSCKTYGTDVPIIEPEIGLSWPMDPSDWNAVFVPKATSSPSSSVDCPLIYGLLDELPVKTKLNPVFCLEILRREVHGFDKIWLPSAGLLIVPVGKSDNEFRRVGRYETAPSFSRNWDRPDDSIRRDGEAIFDMFQIYANRTRVDLI